MQSCIDVVQHAAPTARDALELVEYPDEPCTRLAATLRRHMDHLNDRGDDARRFFGRRELLAHADLPQFGDGNRVAPEPTHHHNSRLWETGREHLQRVDQVRRRVREALVDRLGLFGGRDLEERVDHHVRVKRQDERPIDVEKAVDALRNLRVHGQQEVVERLLGDGACLVREVVKRVRLAGTEPGPEEVDGGCVSARQCAHKVVNIRTELAAGSQEGAVARVWNHGERPAGQVKVRVGSDHASLPWGEAFSPRESDDSIPGQGRPDSVKVRVR